MFIRRIIYCLEMLLKRGIREKMKNLLFIIGKTGCKRVIPVLY